MSKNKGYKLPMKQPGVEKVWKYVEVTKKNEDKPMRFCIQEIPEDMYEDVVEHMCTYFISDEPMCKCINGISDPEYVDGFRQLWRESLKHGLSVAAFAEDSNGGKRILAGVNVLTLTFEEDEFDYSAVKSKHGRNLIEALMGLCKKANVFGKYGVDKYMSAFGLSVHPSYRGAALGGQLLKTREDIGREYNISVTSTGFTSPISQKLAERCGFETLVEQNYKEMVDEEGNEMFPGIESKALKIMARRLY
ncbi:Arylalkylamine N-acetyltransferase-like 2 [Anthophora quadrimaculata]